MMRQFSESFKHPGYHTTELIDGSGKPTELIVPKPRAQVHLDWDGEIHFTDVRLTGLSPEVKDALGGTGRVLVSLDMDFDDEARHFFEKELG